eukprot:CAMPEP_0119336418 /NCGR_PEP_ID=MMETSP1333-20130426/91774_1 /TAXON_ID=418940 /ORGANISM="Scyphosphaera apsteinii, Strain RCC1455" /LENGTH=185 /DNA_ID=CAMNT_0007347219 /DNA_START=151 /DNA_END=704 /DNA_ORIENTATION=-
MTDIEQHWHERHLFNWSYVEDEDEAARTIGRALQANVTSERIIDDNESVASTSTLISSNDGQNVPREHLRNSYPIVAETTLRRSDTVASAICQRSCCDATLSAQPVPSPPAPPLPEHCPPEDTGFNAVGLLEEGVGCNEIISSSPIEGLTSGAMCDLTIREVFLIFLVQNARGTSSTYDDVRGGS